MREILERLTKYAHWVVFILLETLSGFMLFQLNHYQGSVWFTQANAVAGKVLEWEADLLSYIHLKEVNAQLSRDNILLQHEMEVLRHELHLLTKDSTYAQKQQALQLRNMSLLPAQVISNSIHMADNYIVINVGSDHGVQPEMGVVAGTGVVGIVCNVTPRYALVLPLHHSRSSISCRLRHTEYFGYLKWSGRNPLHAYIDDIPRHAQFSVGDVVETSGFSNIFPPGIFIGRIARIRNSSDGLAYQPDVQLSIDLSNVRDVFVILKDSAQEYKTLQNAQKKKK